MTLAPTLRYTRADFFGMSRKDILALPPTSRPANATIYRWFPRVTPTTGPKPVPPKERIRYFAIDFQHLTLEQTLALPRTVRPSNATVYKWHHNGVRRDPKPVTPGIHLSDQRRYLLSEIRDAWDGTTPYDAHLMTWQDIEDPAKYTILMMAMGQKFRVRPIPLRTLKLWIKRYEYSDNQSQEG